MRNLDLTALRSFVAVSESGGVTRAAGLLHLTQSAVSMQLKRLEESLGRRLFDRNGRSLALTADGEQLLGYARRMLQINDEIYRRLTDQEFEGEIILGVPHDVVYPAVPLVLKQFHAAFPRMRVQLISSFTTNLKTMFRRGECDVILTTEEEVDRGGETMVELPLLWVGAADGRAWRERPLRLAFEHNCIFRQGVQEALDRAGIPWEMAVESDSTRTIEASLTADLAVHAMVGGTLPHHISAVSHSNTLPDLAGIKVNLYRAEGSAKKSADEVIDQLCALIRRNFAELS